MTYFCQNCWNEVGPADALCSRCRFSFERTRFRKRAKQLLEGATHAVH